MNEDDRTNDIFFNLNFFFHFIYIYIYIYIYIIFILSGTSPADDLAQIAAFLLVACTPLPLK